MRTQAVWAGRIFKGVWPPIIFGVGFLLVWEWFVEVREALRGRGSGAGASAERLAAEGGVG